MQRSTTNTIKSQTSLPINKSKSKHKTNKSGDVGNPSKISVKAEGLNDGKEKEPLLYYSIMIKIVWYEKYK